MRISELNDEQKGHLAWRLDHKTSCGLITACSVARMQHGDLELVEIFKDYGGLPERSAKIHAAKVRNFKLGKVI